MTEPHIDLITGKPIEPWAQEMLDRRNLTPTASEATAIGAGDAIEAGAKAMCDRVNGIGDYDDNIGMRRSGWMAQAEACISAYLAASPKVASDTAPGVEALALRAIKAVTATAKDGAAGLSRIMVIARAAGVQEPYSELLTDPDVALIVERPRTEWAHLFKPDTAGCCLPPAGWHCTRERGHSGPCAALAASPTASDTDTAIPGGWKLVPIEPTDEMITTFVNLALHGDVLSHGGWTGYARDQWSAMLAASPKPDTDTPVDPGVEGVREAVARVIDGLSTSRGSDVCVAPRGMLIDALCDALAAKPIAGMDAGES